MGKKEIHESDPFLSKCTFNWLSENRTAIPDVWDQGDTYACWAVVVRDTVSAQYFIDTGVTKILSAQELVDCVHETINPDKSPTRDKYGNSTPAASFNDAYIYVYLKGLYTEDEYPFVYKKDECATKDDKYENLAKTFIYGSGKLRKAQFNSDNDYYLGIEKQLKRQPLAAGIRLYDSFKKYNGGIYMGGTPEELADSKQGIHGVLVVGYGIEDGVNYYFIKNSFGYDWGYKGFAKVERQLLTHFTFPYSTYNK